MKTLLLFLLSVLLVGVAAHANLGETEAQVEARYGPVTARYASKYPNSYTKTYLFRSMDVEVVFIDGKSEEERFIAFGEKRQILAAEAQAMLDANNPNGGEWYRPQDQTAETSANTKYPILVCGGRVVAQAAITDHDVVINTGKYNQLYITAGSHL